MIAGLYAGLCGLLLTILYVRVSQRRLATKIGMGTGSDAILEQRIRAHGNFIESVPIALILLYLFEQAGVDSIYVHAFGVALVLARVAHAQGISTTSGRSTGRFYGSIGTLLVIAGLSVWIVATSLMAA
ncbi:MAG: MAPEG family protein [Gammaproteobacteria bacterium]